MEEEPGLMVENIATTPAASKGYLKAFDPLSDTLDRGTAPLLERWCAGD